MPNFNISRRQAALAIVASSYCTTALAESAYPARPIRIIVPFEPGGGTDTMARLMGPGLTASLRQAVVYENRAGAASMIGNTVAAKSVGDGHTMLVGTSAMSLNQAFANKGVMPTMGFDGVRDFRGVGLIGITPYLLVTHAAAPYRDVAALVDAARRSPGSVSYASAGTGGSPHLGGVLLGARAGVQLLHVPFKGSAPAMLALAQGQVDFTYASFAAAKPHLDAGRLRVLAIAAQQRAAFLPDVPTLAQAGVADAEVDSWFGILAPAATSRERCALFAGTMDAVLREPALADRLQQAGAVRPQMDMDAFDDFVKKDMRAWNRFISTFEGSLQ